MRFRRASIAAFGAFTLLLAVPSSASAAVGEFQYRYTGTDGRSHLGILLDPDSGECHNLPHVDNPDTTLPGDTPRNLTTSTATVFTDVDCEGEWFTLRPLVGRGSERLKLRSVVFS
ncbi:hypothetical protein EF910_18790 [Streptomyces sp. WAC07149]|uniref:hypothetical protein n=1 Tax=Streptomyces sp. WAC07149 TaxID=2487425 RepID=UPI000F7AA307|nr:hypothetical protein [Streptomyces sp. WAC07149]RST03822.1 hypothetical protein EF910_18790 [Streptomyces sp. WAC07149]